MNLESKIESVLLFKNEPVSLSALSKILKEPKEKIQETISKLQIKYENSGIIIVTDGDEVSFGTHPDSSSLIEEMQKEELSRELGRAGLETLAIILYKGPITRREIDYIRGVNSTFILRNLLVRGLVDRTEKEGDPSTGLRIGRGYSYKPTLKLLEYLGISRKEDLPEYATAFKKMEEFVKTENNGED